MCNEQLHKISDSETKGYFVKFKIHQNVSCRTPCRESTCHISLKNSRNTILVQYHRVLSPNTRSFKKLPGSAPHSFAANSSGYSFQFVKTFYPAVQGHGRVANFASSSWNVLDHAGHFYNVIFPGHIHFELVSSNFLRAKGLVLPLISYGGVADGNF